MLYSVQKEEQTMQQNKKFTDEICKKKMWINADLCRAGNT